MKIKLKDVTREQYLNWYNKCDRNCNNCMFRFVDCYISNTSANSWINHKHIYNEEFLNQEIEINQDLLTNGEKDFLRVVLYGFDFNKDNVIILFNNDLILIENNNEEHHQPMASIYIKQTRYKFKNVELYKRYKLDDLNIF